MSGSQHDVPQAGNNPVTVSDRVKAPVSSAGPTDSGGGQQPHVQTAENKESVYAKPLIHKSGYLSSNMARRNSVGDPLNTKKRKVMDTSIDLTREAVPYKKEVSKEFLLLQDALSSTKDMIKELGEKMEKNTSRDIKDLSARLRRQANILDGQAINSWLENFRYLPTQKMTYDQDVQVNMAEVEKITTDQNTQTPEEWRNYNEDVVIIDGVDSYDEWKQISERPWPNTIYQNTNITVGNPLESKHDTVKVVLVNEEDREMRYSIQSLYRKRFPELSELHENFEIIEQITKTRTEQVTQKVIKIMVTGMEEELWQSLVKLKEVTKNELGIAMHHITGMTLDLMRKMTETIFHSSETKVTIYTTEKQLGIENERNVTTGRRERKTYALIVEEEGINNNDLLRNIKSSIRSNNASKLIQSISTTRQGKLIIRTEKDDDEIKVLQDAIQKTSKSIRVNLRRSEAQNKTIHIKGMEATTEKEEVKAAIEETVGTIKEENCKMGELRPYGKNNQAITLTLERKLADELINKRNIRVGLVICQVDPHINVPKCFRCWAYDHEAKHCRGPDRTGLCLKCGEEGHKAKECKNDERCLICNERGHKIGSSKCEAFRRALTIARKANDTQTEQQGSYGNKSDEEPAYHQ